MAEAKNCGDVGTVCISTEEYVADKIKIFSLTEQLEKKEKELASAVKYFNDLSDAVAMNVRVNQKFGDFPYICEADKKLLALAGYDPDTFDLTIRPNDEEGE